MTLCSWLVIWVTRMDTFLNGISSWNKWRASHPVYLSWQPGNRIAQSVSSTSAFDLSDAWLDGVRRPIPKWIYWSVTNLLTVCFHVVIDASAEIMSEIGLKRALSTTHLILGGNVVSRHRPYSTCLPRTEPTTGELGSHKSQDPQISFSELFYFSHLTLYCWVPYSMDSQIFAPPQMSNQQFFLFIFCYLFICLFIYLFSVLYNYFPQKKGS